MVVRNSRSPRKSTLPIRLANSPACCCLRSARSETPPHGRRRRGGRFQFQVRNAQTVKRGGGGRHDLLDRPARGHCVKARHIAKSHRPSIHPDAGDACPCATSSSRARVRARSTTDIARAVGGAEQHDRGAGEAGGDRDQMAGEIGDEHSADAGARRAKRREQKKPRNFGLERLPDRPHSLASRAMDRDWRGRAVRSKTSFAATASTIKREQHAQLLAAQLASRAGAELRADDAADSSTRASTASTVCSSMLAAQVTFAATKMIWNSDVPGTTAVGMPQHIDHRRHHDEPAADAEHGAERCRRRSRARSATAR